MIFSIIGGFKKIRIFLGVSFYSFIFLFYFIYLFIYLFIYFFLGGGGVSLKNLNIYMGFLLTKYEIWVFLGFGPSDYVFLGVLSCCRD